MCGHGTLAAAHALWSGLHAEQGRPISFATLSGELTATPQQGDDGEEWIALDFPGEAERAAVEPGSADHATVAAGLGLQPSQVHIRTT